MSCADLSNAPFVYHLPNGSRIEDAILAADNITCIYPQANCSLANSDCCKINPAVDNQASSLIANIAPAAVCYTVILIFHAIRRRSKRSMEKALTLHAQVVEDAKQRGEPPPPMPAELEAEVKRDQQQQERSECTPAKIFEQLGYMGSLGVAIAVPIIMLPSIQKSLDPTHRTAVLAANAFLVPMEDVFCFLEDTMTVRINFAMGAGDRRLVNSLVHVSL